MKTSIAILGLLVSLTHASPAWSGSGTRCSVDCRGELTECRGVFVKGRFYRDCVRKIVSACRHAGSCGVVMPPPPTEQCRAGVYCPLDRPICNSTRMTCERQPSPPSSPSPPSPKSPKSSPSPPSPPVWLPPANYDVTFCADGPVSINCQDAGTFPIRDVAVFEEAIASTLTQFLSQNGAGNCSLGAGELKVTGNGIYVDFGATCMDPRGITISESVRIKIRPS